MSSLAPPRAAIVGPGRAGSHLAAALSAAGWQVAVCDRGDTVPAADITVLAVRDGEIGGVAADLADGRLLTHLSGAHGPYGPVRLALHPAMTFPDRATGPVSLRGVGFALSAADDEAAGWGRRIVADLGGVCVEVATEARPLYHAACALASNALVALEEAAAAAAHRAGVTDPRAFLGPLVAATVANWQSAGRAALTGPVVRGDEETVALHLDVLEGAERDLYVAAAAVARAMVAQ